MSRTVVIAAPAPVVSIAEARMHLRVDDDAEDTLIGMMIDAATQTLDGPAGWLGRAIGRQTLELCLGGFPCGPIRLHYPPVVSIAAVAYTDRAGLPQEVEASAYKQSGSLLHRATAVAWPETSAAPESVRIQYVAGYADGELPAPIRAAILLMVGDLYRHRETTAQGSSKAVPMSMTVANLLATYRVWA